jgi:23S rRNA pseudouridine1911/1915/1917 synthase
MEIRILFETDDVLVINKPAGSMVHPDGRTDEPAITDWIIEHYPNLKGIGEPMKDIDRPGIVHRLDEDTSGVLIVAKTTEAFMHFKQQFMNRTIKKEYHAFVWGHFKELSGIIDAPIGRSSSDFRRKLAGRGVRGETREAVTKWEAVHQFNDDVGEQFSFMHLFPQTGRTHQLRVHMKYIQRPIVSDRLYAESKPDALGFNRLALHARSITFSDLDGKEIRVEAPYPPDFEQALAKYGKA